MDVYEMCKAHGAEVTEVKTSDRGNTSLESVGSISLLGADESTILTGWQWDFFWDFRDRQGSRDRCLSSPILNEARLLYLRVRLAHFDRAAALFDVSRVYIDRCALWRSSVKRAFSIVKMEIADAIKHSLCLLPMSREKFALFCELQYATR